MSLLFNSTLKLKYFLHTFYSDDLIPNLTNNIQMLIVQISDLHVGSQFLQEKFDILVNEVNELNPGVIIITGDLTNEGLMKEYEQCKSLLKQFNTKKIITISGNHDYRNTGYLLFKKFFPFETVNELRTSEPVSFIF